MARGVDGAALLRRVEHGELYALHDGSGVTERWLNLALGSANGRVSSLKFELAQAPKVPTVLINLYTFVHQEAAAACVAKVDCVFAKLFDDNRRAVAQTDATVARTQPLTRLALQTWLDGKVIHTGGWNAGIMIEDEEGAAEQIALAESDPAALAVARPPLPPPIPPHPLALLRHRRPAFAARSLARPPPGVRDCPRAAHGPCGSQDCDACG